MYLHQQPQLNSPHQLPHHYVRILCTQFCAPRTTQYINTQIWDSENGVHGCSSSVDFCRWQINALEEICYISHYLPLYCQYPCPLKSQCHFESLLLDLPSLKGYFHQDCYLRDQVFGGHFGWRMRLMLVSQLESCYVGSELEVQINGFLSLTYISWQLPIKIVSSGSQ